MYADTRLVYKRSRDHGKSWSALSVFTQDASQRAENGLCQSQAAPVIDPVSKTLIVGFINNGAGCEQRGATYFAEPMLVNSSDDGPSSCLLVPLGTLLYGEKGY